MDKAVDIFSFGTGLIVAEIYAWVVLVLGFIQTIWPLQRRPVALNRRSRTGCMSTSSSRPTTSR